jgi:heme a synthase
VFGLYKKLSFTLSVRYMTVFSSPSDSRSQTVAGLMRQATSILRWSLYGLSLATLCLMALGSATRVMNAGLSCPDWPLCYGTVLPAAQMNLQVFLEWFHRLVASTVGLVVIVVTSFAWWQRRSLPGWLPTGLTFSLGLIVVQGILGGLTVTELLRFDIVTAHLATGLFFFSSLVVMASCLTPVNPTGVGRILPWSAMVAAGFIYFQSVLGALVASRWAVHQCLGTEQLCQVLHNHMYTAIPASLSVLWCGVQVWRSLALGSRLQGLLLLVLGLVSLQVLIGVSTLRLHLQVEWLTISHQVVGAGLLGTLLVLSVFTWRGRKQNQQLLAS